MLNKNEKKLLRKFILRSLPFNNLIVCNIHAKSIVMAYLDFLCFDEHKITLKQYYRYENIFNKVMDNYYNQNDIISFKGVVF